MTRTTLQKFLGLALCSLLTAQVFAQEPSTPVWSENPPAPQDQQQVPVSPQDQQQQAQDDGTHGVGRISVINGEVSVRRGDSGEVTAAAINAPLLSQDRLLTSSSSRAEIQFDNANMVRLGANAELRLSDVQRGKYIMELATGTVTYRVLRDSRATAEIDTPSVAVRPTMKGIYRVTVREDGTSEITVRSGQAEIYTPNGSQTLQAGQTMLARGSASDPEFQTTAAIGYDDWDRWNSDRDRDLQQSRSYRYVSPDISGAEDLDNYGRWQYSDPYGYVWVPQVSQDWAPYQQGRWAWEDYYGWSWVSYDPWGWAPYHYGRWFRGSFGWGWYPGVIGASYYWAPAYVGFFGFGVGFGNIGWCALAPFEGFHRWWGSGFYGGYGRNNVFINNTTIVNNTNITNIYRNARYTNGVTAMRSDNFGRMSTVGNTVRVSQGDLRGASMVRGQVPVVPNRTSLNFNNHTVNARNFPVTTNRQFYSHAGVSNTQQRIPFEQQQRNMQQVQRQAFNGGANAARTVPNAPSANGRQFGNTQPATNGSSPNTGRGWSRVGDFRPGGTQNTTARPSDNSGNARWGQIARQGSPAQPANTERGNMERPGNGVSGSPATRSSTPSNGGWQRFGGAQSNGQSTAPNSQPLRMNPSIVRDRPSESNAGRGFSNAPSNTRPSYSSPSYNRPSYSAPSNNRPSYSQPSYNAPSYNRPSYSAPSNNRPSYSAPSRSYNAPSYSRPSYSQPSYSAPSYSRPSYSAPSYNRPSYSAPSYSAPSRSYSAPSYSAPSRSYSAPSYGGGGHSSGGGGGGGRSFGGGGGSFGGGGGGGHSSGGGHHR